MKKLLMLSFLVAISLGLQAQIKVDKTAKKEAKHYVKVLKLDKSQKVEVQNIIGKKYNDLEEIASLINEDHALYRAKRRAIYAGMDGSIRLILNREQTELFDIEKRRQRIVNADKIKQLQASGADQEDIMDAQYGIQND